MTTLSRPGVPVGGFKTVGQIHATNNLIFQRNQNAMGVAVELLATHTAGAPVVDERGEFIGFVSEFDILRVLEAKKDLNQLTAEDVMAKDRIWVTNDTSIDEAVKIMEEKPLRLAKGTYSSSSPCSFDRLVRSVKPVTPIVSSAGCARVHLVCFVYLVSLVQPNKHVRPAGSRISRLTDVEHAAGGWT